MSKDYDAIIIGAGSVGVPTAYFLAKEGLKTLCLDNRSSSGQGENKAAIGGVRATHSDPAKITICRESLRIFSTWKDTIGTDIGWKEGGYCFPIYTESDENAMKSMLPIQKKFGLDIDWSSPEEIAKAVPGINPRNLRGGTLSPKDGQVSPLMAIESFTQEAKKLGAEFRFREEVKSFTMEGNMITSVQTQNGTYSADKFVNAAGANATAICEMAGFSIPVIPDSHEAGITSPVRQFLAPLVVDIREGPEGMTKNFYFGQVESGQIIFCYTPLKPIVGQDRRETSEFMPIIARRLVDLIPRLKGLTIRRLWRGLYPMTPDGVPVIGKAPGVENMYLGIGMCGQGFMMGPGVGYNLASHIVKGKPAMDRKIYELLSPSRNFGRGKAERLA
ncbi:MAG: FAD-binding oxidoreductase [Candidatus Thermoplasmatota archaeon]|nr:FAD-binding oxidoreductase [Euryarchaeota archaeon]MBU4032059.1 FAD-binding oxidoreductase [Candidatus Thermoplasmatota archaeon]MBU4071682.1 FAD-binding oxidoreductase [Candidatus Thermoplasmatota archaeon]MBU4145054.1 FAD-binding oxidoreductase [Candidatus Thermoplasmatota archaeon]MBU4591990.1 FAD-binding oxidoreductase [Candidatus Thermoplasmatota archaeon]